MIFEIKKTKLEKILNDTQNFIDKKDHQVNSQILIEANKNTITIKAFDGEMGIINKIQNEIQEEGQILIGGREFIKIVKSLKNEDIKFKSKEDNLIITQNNFRSKLPIFQGDDYIFPEINIGEDIKINSNQFKETLLSIKKIYPAIDISSKRKAINCALIEMEDEKISLIATDTRRLFISSNTNNEINNIDCKKILISRKTLIELPKLFKDIEEISIKYNEQNLIFKSEDDSLLVISKTINEVFPEYRRIMPINYKYEIKMNKKELQEVISRLKNTSEKIVMTIKIDEIKLETKTSDRRHSMDTIKIDTYLDKEFIIGFDAKYVLDYLNLTDDENIVMGVNDPNKPFLIRSEEDKYKGIIMPLFL